MIESISNEIPAECPWRDTLYWYDAIDSTNTRAKVLAREGAPQGTVVIAGSQSAGRGRLGRSFHSPRGLGIYLSVILRPQCPPSDLMHLTCAVGVAMCDAVEAAAGVRPGIKWINDLVLENKKLGGILTELSVDSTTGLTEYAIVGIGINCRHRTEDFPPELCSMATSLELCGYQAQLQTLSAEMVIALERMNRGLLREKDTILARYRADCITLGREICVHRFDTVRAAKALDVDESGALVVQYEDGSCQSVNSGEVSVRGLYGYL